MSFPQTRLTLVQRLAAGGSEEDWNRFLSDYWGPVCRFALRFGARNLDDAEDVASLTFETLWKNQLLVRWLSNRSAKLRSLLCGVARKVLSNQNRAGANRDRLLRELADWVRQSSPVEDPQADAFYGAWVEDVVGQAVESLAAEYYRQAKGDYVRVLYGRLCQRLTIAEVAEAIDITTAAVDNYYRHAKRRLTEKLESLVRRQVHRYCTADEADQEFTLEWQRLGQHLADYGGLEEAVRRAYDLLDPVAAKAKQRASVARAVSRLTSIIRRSTDRPSS
jgi:RNA polymerase sigma factor (sigma-70 family)